MTRVSDDSMLTVRQIVAEKLAGLPARVWLHGSRATGRSTAISDIDIAILADSPLSPDLLAELRDTLEESDVPYHVDVIDLAHVDRSFRNKIEREGILWLG